ncbi:MAG: NAD(P)H-dependent glycerol-3-phosphate dehydrogenase [Parvularculaceae bacterium]
MTQAPSFSSITVIGGGAWGTALANLAAHNGIDVLIWAREPEVADAINARHENTVFLKGAPLHEALRATSQLDEAAGREAFLFVVPAQFARPILAALSVRAGARPVALCSKGIERETGLMMTDVLAETWPEAIPAILSGPSFARDVAKGLPTAVTLACPDPELGGRWTATLAAPHFRLYLSDDLVGAELGGAVKNVLAIAAGAVEGRGLGESARAALIARGFAEFQRLGVALGAKPQTMAGLSGLGDLILTACSPQSRNMSLGLELGRGRGLEEILGERNTVSEGVASAAAVARLAEKAGVDMPICNAVRALVAGERTVDEIAAELLARPLKAEAG